MFKLYLERYFCDDIHTYGKISCNIDNWECLCVERRHLSQGSPMKPEMAYALPEGEYDLKFKYHAGAQFCPQIIRVPKYKGIGFINFKDLFKAGCVMVGNNWVNYNKVVDGFVDSMQGLTNIIIDNWDLFKDQKLVISQNADFMYCNSFEYIKNNLIIPNYGETDT